MSGIAGIVAADRSDGHGAGKGAPPNPTTSMRGFTALGSMTGMGGCAGPPKIFGRPGEAGEVGGTGFFRFGLPNLP